MVAGPIPFVIAAILFISIDWVRLLVIMLIVVFHFCFLSICFYMLNRPTETEKEHKIKSMS